jgi:hypothetical protein
MIKGIVGGFLKLAPVKRTLMNEAIRSRFLDGMKKAALKRGKGIGM